MAPALHAPLPPSVAHKLLARGIYDIILSDRVQGLFQDFASEGANVKCQNSKGGKYKS